MTDDMPRTLADEMAEVAEDADIEFLQRLPEAGPEVINQLNTVVKAILAGYSDNLVPVLTGALMHYFMMGREHALRGYASPFERDNSDQGQVISDEDIDELLRGNDE